MQEIMTCQNCLIGWMESAARNFTYPLGMKTALYKKRFFVKFWGAKVSMHSWRGHALNTVRVLFRCVC